MTYKILVPTDFSKHSDMAIRLATSFAKDHQLCEVTLLHVSEPSVPQYDEALGTLQPEKLRTQTQALEQQRRFQDADTPGHVHFQTAIRDGNPSDLITAYAAEHGCDLIVMGTHGRTGLVQLVMGSVAEAVMRRAECPVMTVRVPGANVPDRPLE